MRRPQRTAFRQCSRADPLEGPQSIAAIMMESIVGAGGAHKHPAHTAGRAIALHEHGIVLILDEVMVGFGRTGSMWGFQHYDGVVPDIVTSARVSAAYLPLAMVGVRQHIKEVSVHWNNAGNRSGSQPSQREPLRMCSLAVLSSRWVGLSAVGGLVAGWWVEWVGRSVGKPCNSL